MSEKMRKAVGREFDRLDSVMNRLNAVRAARQYADSAHIPLVAKEHIRGLALLLESVLAEQPAISCAAIRTLQHFGYSYHGGALWKPPIGERPTWLAEQPAQGAHSPFANSENSVETHAGSRQPAQGEAVAWVNAKALKLWTENGSTAALAVRLKDQNQQDFIPLYTAPPAPSVPDEQKLMRDSGPADAGFVRGWNACRAAMLAVAPKEKP